MPSVAAVDWSSSCCNRWRDGHGSFGYSVRNVSLVCQTVAGNFVATRDSDGDLSAPTDAAVAGCCGDVDVKLVLAQFERRCSSVRHDHCSYDFSQI